MEERNTVYCSLTFPRILSYYLGKGQEKVITELEKSSRTIFKWFENNGMKANPESVTCLRAEAKALLPILGKTKFLMQKQGNSWGITFDNQLIFNNRISNLYKTAINKLHVLPRVAPYMNQGRKRVLFSSYFSSQFFYSPLLCIGTSRSLNNKIINYMNKPEELCTVIALLPSSNHSIKMIL